jgi:4-diphosphocytidyl-2-C-methyl-D-erythritol kinase
MTGMPASESDLIEWSAELGSDITFFLSQGSAYCTGRGEIITPVPELRSKQFFIIKVT